MALAAQMSRTQLDDLEKLIDVNDRDKTLVLMAANLPNCKNVINSQLEELKVETRGIAADILRI
jgi:hypothetical protein